MQYDSSGMGMRLDYREVWAAPLWRALALACGLITSIAHAQGEDLPLAIAPHLDAHAPAAGSAPVAQAEHATPVVLQLSAQLAQPVDNAPPADKVNPVAAPATPPAPSGRGLWTFTFWFALLLLIGIAARDSMRVMLQILWQPAPPRARLPYASWPSICLSFSANDAESLEQTLWRIRDLDYPPERLLVVALIDMASESALATLKAARPQMRSEVIASPLDTQLEPVRQCFAAGLQHGRGDIVMTIPAGEPIDSQSLKQAAEAFLDPTLGALLGYLPPGTPGDQGIAARLGRLQRRATTQLDLPPPQSVPPGTGLVAIRRGCVQSASIDPTLPNGTLSVLLDIEAAAWRISLQPAQIAAGAPMQDWDSRAKWLRRRARARIESNAAVRLFGLLRHGRFAGEPGPMLTLLWIAVLLASLLRFFMGDIFSAAIGLAACMACAFGVEARPASLLALGILLRTTGRNPAAILSAFAPVVFLHDLQVTLRQTIRSVMTRLRPGKATATARASELGAPSVTTH
ncbi:hypothetical protein [Viridibacterium curvum]|uniref:Glycosyltransferase n=1 Tax=Viridibacterium curvum TaxID=1101404 RepID=A0ABP9QXT8_9RHOO